MRAPVLAVGDGALRFWKALAEVFAVTRHQRCWVHKIANVANALPKSAQPGAKKALQEIYNAEDRDHALKAAAAFAKTYGAKFPKAVKKITDDVDELLTFYKIPLSTGSTYAPRTRSSRPSPPSGCEQRSREVPAARPPPWPWSSSSSSPRRPAGGR